MPAAPPRLYFQPLCQYEVLRVISTLNAGSLCSRHVNYGNTTNVFFFIFSQKRHKIVEIFALLTTELSSYKMCKVGMLSLGFNLMFIDIAAFEAAFCRQTT